MKSTPGMVLSKDQSRGCRFDGCEHALGSERRNLLRTMMDHLFHPYPRVIELQKTLIMIASNNIRASEHTPLEMTLPQRNSGNGLAVETHSGEYKIDRSRKGFKIGML
ncbi:hypothetical protein HAX54_007229, partial [Datura stramonium]|nr:hypothetical protein [Datura stramonium]